MNDISACTQTILNCMDSNKLSLTSFLTVICSIPQFSNEARSFQSAISSKEPLSTDEARVQRWVMKLATSILKSEVQELMDKKFGLHMHATSLKAEQFEKGHVCFLKLLYEEKGPNTWGLLRQLLDVQHINHA